MYDNIRIETEQLIIRNFRAQDLPALHRLVNSEEIMEFVPFTRSRTMPEGENVLHNIMMKPYQESTPEKFVGFILLVESKATNSGVGFVGLCPLAYDRSEKELFYGIIKEVWGKGYGTEIARGLIQYGMEEMKLNKMVATANVGNDISIKILEKVGMKFKHVIEPDETDDECYEGELLYAIHASDYFNTTV
jgi:ribosomal-protein-alanine N-acetyltransferase